MNFGLGLIVTPQGSYSNNPWHQDETPNSYLQRKRAQIAEIKVNILPQTDFLFLQEPDFIVRNVRSPEARQTGVAKHLRETFEQTLADNNFGIRRAPRYNRDNEYNYKANVICYNEQVLTPVANSMRGLFADENNIYHGMAFDFTLNSDLSVVITLVSLHMDYEIDYFDEYFQFLQAQAAAGKHTVMAGDTNHPANLEQGLKTGDENYPTAFDSDNNNVGQFTVKDERNDSPKTYDGFISWPKNKGLATTTVTQGRFFKVNQDQIERCTFDPQNDPNQACNPKSVGVS